MPFAQALSLHPDPAEATGEVAGAVLEALDGPPDLAVLFCSPHHTGAVADIAAAVRALLRPRILVGATAVAVVGGPREVEDDPAVSLWAARLPVAPRPLRLAATRTPSGLALSGLSGHTFAPGDSLLLLADPFSLPVDAIIEALGRLDPPVPVVGGMASAAAYAGDNRLVLDGEVHDTGGVGVVLPADVATSIVVSQGCRPVGQPMIVTRSEGNLLLELAGRPALDRLDEMITAADPDERTRIASGLQVGVAIDEHRMTFGPGDFVVRAVLGADGQARALAVGQHVDVGTTVQFQVRDADAADHDLRSVLAGAGPPADAALVFTCNGRGMRFFGDPDHDAQAVQDVVGPGAVAGMFCAGEFGPVGGRSFVHGYTASILFFHDPDGPREPG